MTLEQRISEDIKTAMLARDKQKLDALRAVKSAILLAKTQKGKATELDEAAEIKILKQLIKQRQDSATLYQAQHRDDLYREEKAQLDIIQTYLPQMLTDEEIETAVRQIVADNGFNSMKDMGKAMAMANQLFAGRADNRKVSETVKRLLS